MMHHTNHGCIMVSKHSDILKNMQSSLGVCLCPCVYALCVHTYEGKSVRLGSSCSSERAIVMLLLVLYTANNLIISAHEKSWPLLRMSLRACLSSCVPLFNYECVHKSTFSFVHPETDNKDVKAIKKGTGSWCQSPV